MSGLSAARYARSIERRWQELSGRPVVFSPREWALISDWHARGVPLDLVEDAIAEASERARRGRALPRSLGYLAGAVEEAWAAVVDGRVEAHPEQPPADSRGDLPGVEAWRARERAEPVGSPLRRLLRELLAALEAGAPPSTVDERLDAELVDAAPTETRRRLEAAIDTQLAGFRGRMDADRLATTRRRALVARLREELVLPRPAGAQAD